MMLLLMTRSVTVGEEEGDGGLSSDQVTGSGLGFAKSVTI